MKTNKTGNAGANGIGAKTYENPVKTILIIVSLSGTIAKWIKNTRRP
jgi:hypothetical protein